MSSLVVFEAAIAVKSTHLIKSCLKPEKKEVNMEINEILNKTPSKRSFKHSIHWRADAIYRRPYLTHIAI